MLVLYNSVLNDVVYLTGKYMAESKQIRKKCVPYNIKYVFNFRVKKFEFKQLKSPLELLLGSTDVLLGVSGKGGGEGLIK